MTTGQLDRIMNLVAASIYWVIVALWVTVLVTVLLSYFKNPRAFGTTRLLLCVLAIDTFRNIFENVYFGLYFGGMYGLFPHVFVAVLGQSVLLIVPKILNVLAGCVVLGLLLMRWLPMAISERETASRYADYLEDLATTDPLTKLYNRRHFETAARAELARFQRYFHPLSILILDVDHFKSINDRFGHAAGDTVLTAIADACRSVKRATDIAARIGGEEFAILLPETAEEAARSFAERLRHEISESAPIIEGEKLALTASVGVAMATRHTTRAAALLRSADEALYQAKRTGRDRVCVATQDVDSELAAAQ
jgi:diguanylate cyclase (GGDEF)-like protein